jgi:hypothetical protein
VIAELHWSLLYVALDFVAHEPASVCYLYGVPLIFLSHVLLMSTESFIFMIYCVTSLIIVVF